MAKIPHHLPRDLMVSFVKNRDDSLRILGSGEKSQICLKFNVWIGREQKQEITTSRHQLFYYLQNDNDCGMIKIYFLLFLFECEVIHD